MSYRPRSSLPIEVLRWLTERLAHLCPARRPGRGGTPPLDGLSYRRGARMVGICRTEVGEAVCVDGLATRGQRPGGWANQKVLDDAKRRAHTARAWRCRPSTAIYCGVTVAGLGAALLYRVRDVDRAAAALGCLGRWIHRIPT